jgi:S-formylglutathione hydrolase FrmB
MYPWSYDTAGRFDEHVFSSEALRRNPLGDPHERPLWVYVPPGYDDEPDQRYPSIYVIQGYTGQLDMWRNRMPFGAKTFPELTDELFSAEDERYRTLASRDHRAIAGKSSGGYGAMVTALLRPELFGALATHAGDALFENCYARDFPVVARALRDRYGGSYERFWEDFRSRPGIYKPDDHELLNTWGMAAAYSEGELPIDVATGELRPDVWARWLEWDPVRMARDRPEAVRSWRAVYIDAGKGDEYFLDLGAEAFRRVCEELGARDVFFELFEGKHGGITYRYPLALRYLAERLAP